ncbi:hypothetical protein Sros_0236 [Streptosporangium roseum DSM 43021]|uniref:Uncharacterized protein n=1 Tax=Streptosporangium roseum (strain ATCC 12428 / DSM 43021 / JCM 3005 / KCTC 9067 / NCIMB 10171 / NRRL 2505 / NI 9100) TaxID=479432 RepID=D2AZ91_STRRD|nr:hypothetical protein Sros_0236 [Streptosporangium roseum DSM 43021]
MVNPRDMLRKTLQERRILEGLRTLYGVEIRGIHLRGGLPSW